MLVLQNKKVRQHKARQKNTRQSEASQGKTGQDQTPQKSDKTQQDKTRQDQARRGGARQSKTCKRKTGRGRQTSVMGYTLLPRWSFWLFFKRAGALATTSKELVYFLEGAPRQRGHRQQSTDNKEAIDRQQRGHRQPSSDNRPETATNNHSHECMCVCGCMFVDVFAHIHTSKGEKTKKGLGGSARAQFGAPLKGNQRKVAVFLHETHFPLLCVF